VGIYIVGTVALYFLVTAAVREFAYGSLAAVVWHWKHGDKVQVEGYEITVPKRWFSSDTGQYSKEIDRVNFVSVVLISNSSRPSAHLDQWKATTESLIRDKDKVEPESREMPLGSHNRIICIQGKYIRNRVSIDCRSDAKLGLLFIGRAIDVQEFYGIVANIRVLP